MAQSRPGASSPVRARSMKLGEGLDKARADAPERHRQQVPPGHDHIVMPQPQTKIRREAEGFAETPTYAVALDGVADLLGDREADSRQLLAAPLWPPTTLRPPTVAMRDRKPCRRLRTILLGWKVRFT